MNYAFLFAFIAPLLLYVTNANAYHHDFPPFHSGFNGHAPIHGAEFEISAEGPPLAFIGICFHWHPFGHRWFPDFLKNVSGEGMNDFCDIVMNENLTKAETEEQLNKWAKNQGGNVQERLNNYVEQKRQKWDKIQETMEELIANVSQFISEVQAIKSDMGLTKRNEKEKLFELARTTDWGVLALAKRIRAEAGFIVGEHRRGPCPECGPRFPPMFPPVQPPFMHHRPRFGPQFPGRGPHFPGDDGGLFGENGPFGNGGPFGENGPFGQNRVPGRDGPFGHDGPFGQSGNPPYGQSFGENRSPLPGRLFRQNGNPSEDGPFEQIVRPGQNGQFGPAFGLW